MRSKPQRQRRTLLFLIVLCVALGVVVYLESGADPVARVGRVADDADIGTEVRMTKGEGTDVSLPPLDEFSATVERPLFASTRRPPSIDGGPAEQTAGNGKRELFDLVGVVISMNERMALLQRKRSREIIRVEKGHRVDGWEVQGILPNRVFLQLGDRTRELKLEDLARPAVDKRAAVPPRSVKKLAEKYRRARQEADEAGGAAPMPEKTVRE